MEPTPDLLALRREPDIQTFPEPPCRKPSRPAVKLIIVPQQDCCAQRAGHAIISRDLLKAYPFLSIGWTVKPELKGAFEIETTEGEKLWSALEVGRMPLKGQAREVVGRYLVGLDSLEDSRLK